MEAAVIAGPGRVESIGAQAGTSRGKTVTAHATPGTDGAWTELIAATTFEYHKLHLRILPVGAVASRLLLDIGVGAAGSEKVLVADIPYDQMNAGSLTRSTSYGYVVLPLYVAQGARIALRAHRSSAASATVDVMLHGEQNSARGLPPFRRCTTYGTVLASAQGTNLDPGATANTLGAFVEIAASLTNPVKQVYFILNRQEAAIGTADLHWLVNVYRGAAAAEKLEISSLTAQFGASSDHCDGAFAGPFDVNWPAGARITMKAQCSSNAAVVRILDACFLGLD